MGFEGEGTAAHIGSATDDGNESTLFAKALRSFLGTHSHALVVIHDTSAPDADLDTALKSWLEDIGFIVTLCDPTDIAGNLQISHFDLVIISASCVAGDVTNLANLRTVELPLICHSAAIAASVILDMGGTPHSHAAQTEIEIVDNTVVWLLDQATGDLEVTASAAIQAMNTKAAAAITLAEEATGTGDHLTIVILSAGDDNDATNAYAAFFDRYFVGVGDYTNMNSVFKAIMVKLIHHMIHEKRFSEDNVVQVKGVYKEQIPDTDFSKTAIDNALSSNPPSADAANRIVDIDQKNKRTYVLRSLWVNVTSFGGGTQLTFQLWLLLNGTVTSVESKVVNSTGIIDLMDLFGVSEVHGDGIWVTAITDSGSTGACSGTYRFAEAKK